MMHAREAEWPADQVERWPLTKLIPYARNARAHSEEQIAQIAASIREWGWTVPVLVDEQGTLIAGHGRVLAAQQLGITDVPTMVARGWTHAQIQAYRLTDNQLALNAGWDLFQGQHESYLSIRAESTDANFKIYADPITPMRHLLPGIAPSPFA